MTRYAWPGRRRSARGRQPSRTAWNLSRDAGADLPTASAVRAQAMRIAALAPGAPGSTGAWQPLGPTTTVDGTPTHRPRTAGRCRDIAVNPADPRRIYVASALGGLWYSDNFGVTWIQVGAFTTLADRSLVPPSSTSLSCGAVYVKWAASEAEDEVWVGTGEPHPIHLPHDRGYKGMFAGFGILYAEGPVARIRATPDEDPWIRQAQSRTGYDGLAGASVFSFAADPADQRRIVAATTRGLHVHDPAPGSDTRTDPWSLVDVAAWNEATGSPGSAKVVVTDVSWVDGTRLWVSVRQAGSPLTGLWRSDAGPAGPFVDVPIGARDAAGEPSVDRIAIAGTPGAADVLYVMSSGPGSSPALHRVDGPSTVRPIANVPQPFFGVQQYPGDPDQSAYDMAIAVDPDDPQRFMIGGAATDDPNGDVTAAALFRFRLPPTAPAPDASWPSDYAFNLGTDDTWVGQDVHADVHRIRWLRKDGDVHVYVCTDGGVFHSALGGDLDTYASRATGMSVTEEIFSVSHPASDGVVLSGVQDNGVQLRIGDGVWRRAIHHGDGGGVAFDPRTSHQFIAQATRSYWTDQNDVGLTPTVRTTENDTFLEEHRASSFYSNPAVIDNGSVTQLAIGTTRVWFSDRWGFSVRSPQRSDLWVRQWMTLPSLADPRFNDHADLTTDVIDPGPLPPGTIDTRATGVRILRWGGVDRLYVLMPGSVHRIDRTGPDRWRTTRIEKRPTLPVRGTPDPIPSMASGGPHLPPTGSLNDLAVHDAGAGRHGSFYIATSHPEEPLWWFDGSNRFHPCGLGTTPPPTPPITPGSAGGIRAPAYAVLTDPRDPAVVYVGTALGVFRGELSFDGRDPSWHWSDLNNGLPEAAVQDLTITSWPTPEGGTITLMRACLQARGVWELDLSPGGAVDLTFLRAQPYDTRRILPTPMVDPLFDPERLDRDWPLDLARIRNRNHRNPDGTSGPHPDGTPREVFLWHESPDIRLRPAPGSAPLAVPGPPFPWAPGVVLPTDRFSVWALQTALHALDDRVVADGLWSFGFERRLESVRGRLGLTRLPVVDADLWTHPVVQAGFWADPWAPGGPTEADLIERVVGMLTPRPDAAARSAASVALPAQPSKVEVCVHRRGITAAAGKDVAVLLLLRQLTQPPTEWHQIATPALTGLAALDGLPDSGGALPADITIPADWELADTVVNVRRPTRDARPSESTVVSFDVDFTGRSGIWLLLAVVRHGTGTPVLDLPTDLADLVRTSPQLAARTVEVVAPPAG